MSDTTTTTPRKRRRSRKPKAPTSNEAAPPAEATPDAPAGPDAEAQVATAEPSADKDKPEPAAKPVVTGVLEVGNRPDGRLRTLDKTYIAEPTDPVVPVHLLDKFGLRGGTVLEVELGKPMGGGPQHNGQQHGGGKGKKKKKQKSKLLAISPDAKRVAKVFTVDGEPADQYANDRRRFEDLTTIDPRPRINLEYPDRKSVV